MTSGKATQPEQPEIKGWVVAIVFFAAVAMLFIQSPLSQALGWAWFLKPMFIILRFSLFVIALVSGITLIRLKAAWLPLSVLLFWTLGISIQGYYFTFGGSGKEFVPTPWTDADISRWIDLNSPTLLGSLWENATYLFAMTLCLAVQLAQSWIGIRSGIGELPKAEKIILRFIGGFCYALDLFAAIKSAPALDADPGSLVGWFLQFVVMIFGFEVLLIGLMSGFRGISNYFDFLAGKAIDKVKKNGQTATTP